MTINVNAYFSRLCSCISLHSSFCISLCHCKSGMYALFLLPIGLVGVPRVLVNIGEMPIGESKEDLVKGVPRPKLKLVEVELISSRGGHCIDQFETLQCAVVLLEME